TADLLRERKIVICGACRDTLREMQLYCWDQKAGQDRVRKEHDHAMDEMRYFAVTVVARARDRGCLGGRFVERGKF
ncbi:MAG: PBSX family phage terminase large subunit, partial [Pseudoflavonifractor sp.]